MQTIARGARGEDVRDVQARLHALGFRTDPDDRASSARRPKPRCGSSSSAATCWWTARRPDHLAGDGRSGLRARRSRPLPAPSVRPRRRRPSAPGPAEPARLQRRARGRHLRSPHRPRHPRVPAQRRPPRRRDRGGDDAAGARPPPAGRPGAGPATVREREALRGEASLRGARIAMDAGHGPGDPGETGPSGLDEAGGHPRAGRAVGAMLAEHGAHPLLLPAAGENPTESERAARPTREGADLLISLHLNAHGDPLAEGATVFYCGREGWVSESGQRLAELIQDELVGTPASRTGGRIRSGCRSFARRACRPCASSRASSRTRARSGAPRRDADRVDRAGHRARHRALLRARGTRRRRDLARTASYV